jgi:hypothetical protein
MSEVNNKSVGGCNKKSAGFVLLLTLVLLIALATLGYVLSSKLLESRSRNQYLIDYTQARYACDSGIKYALATIEQIRPALISRPNEPDFSDLFNLTEPEYQNFLADWAEWVAQKKYSPEEQLNNAFGAAGPNDVNSFKKLPSFKNANDVNDIVDINNPSNLSFTGSDVNDYNVPVVVRGPYGPAWPLVFAPMEFEIGTAKVTIEVEDENAKYPLALALLSDEKLIRESQASLQTFLRWMWNRIETDNSIDFNINSLQKQLDQIKEIKQVTADFKPLSITEQQTQPPAAASAQRVSGTRVRSARLRTATTRNTLTAADQQNRQNSDFARIFHSSLIDLDLLARPTVESPTRKESALRYISLWATTKVNINTAPRHVLESIFVFGGKEKEIADQIILKRRIKPFGTIDDLKKELFSYSDVVDKCKNFISTESTFFTIRISAVSGGARSSVLIAVSRQGNQTKRIAMIAS